MLQTPRRTRLSVLLATLALTVQGGEVCYAAEVTVPIP